jgi:tetratricopeptide (TPR) repeat protein
MNNILKFFEKDTSAAATNRGFLFQYLHTLNEWVNIYRDDDRQAKILCEFEDDIYCEKGESFYFKQVKCYKRELKFSSPKFNEAAYNYFIIDMKYGDKDLNFFFITNKESTDEVINNWEKYKSNDFKGYEIGTVEAIKSTVTSQCLARKNNKVSSINDSKSLPEVKKMKIEEIIKSYEEITLRIESYDWLSFCKKINFQYENKTIDSFREELIEKVKSLGSDVPEDLIYSRMLQVIAEKSCEDIISDRELNYVVLDSILKETKEQILLKLKNSKVGIEEIKSVITISITPFLQDIKHDTGTIVTQVSNISKEISDIKEIMQQINNHNINPEFYLPKDMYKGIALETESDEKHGNITCDKLCDIVIEKIDKLIDSGELSKAEKVIKDILDSEECPVYTEKFSVDLTQKLGVVYVNRGDIENAKCCIEKLDKMKTKTINKYKFMSTMACILQDEILLEKAIGGLTECGVNEVDRITSRLRFDLTKGKYQEVIERITINGDIKSEFKDTVSALEYLGVAYLHLRNYFEATKFLNQANELKYSWYRQYLILLSEVDSITSKVGSLYLLSSENKLLIKTKYMEVKQLDHFFAEMGPEELSNYWLLRLRILLFCDIDAIPNEFNEIPGNLKDNDNIRLMMADYQSLINDETAYSTYKDIYEKHKDTEILIKILTSLFLKKNYEKIIEILDGLDYKSDFDSLGRVAGIYIESIKETAGIEAALEKFEMMYPYFTNAPFLFDDIAELYFHKNDIKNVNKYLMLLKQAIPEENYPPRYVFSQNCERLGFINIAIEVIEPLSKYSLNAKKRYINYLLKTEDEEHRKKVDIIIDDLINTDKADFDIFSLKAHLEFESGKQENALLYLEKSFSLKPTYQVAYNIIGTKLNLNKIEALEDFLEYLKTSQEATHQILVSMAYKKLGNIGLSDFYSYKALALLGENFNEQVYGQFIMMNLMDNQNERQLSFERISSDKAIQLSKEDNSNVIWICISSEKDLIIREPLVFCGCTQYSIDSKISILLRNKKINDLIRLDDGIYKVSQVLDRKTKFMQFCMEAFSERCPDAPYLKSIKVTEDDPISPIIPMLVQMKERGEFLIRQYNFENGLGLPLYALSENNYNRYLDTIFQVLNMNNQVFYAGEINKINLLDTKIVLTLSTLVFLNYFKLLDNLSIYKENLYIPKSMYDTLLGVFNDSEKFDLRTAGSMSIDDKGKPIFINITEEQNENRFDFWRNIVLFTESINILPDIETYSDTELIQKMREISGNIDVNCVLLAREISAITISEDLFVRKMVNSIDNTNISTNSITIIMSLGLEINSLLEVLLSLSKCSYHYLLSEQVIIEIATKISIKPIIYGEGTLFNMVSKIIRNLLSNPVIYRDYINILVGTYNKLYEKRFNPAFREIINIIVEELKIASNAYGIKDNIIIGYVNGIFKMDVIRAKYFEHMYFTR